MTLKGNYKIYSNKIKFCIILNLDYQFSYNKVEQWAKLDIAIVEVEIPFDYSSPVCMYKPEKIKINFDVKYEADGIDVTMLGWGHSKKWTEVRYYFKIIYFPSILIPYISI